MKIVTQVKRWLSALDMIGRYGWRPWIHEPYSGAWQRGAGEPNTRDPASAISNSTVFACATMISADVGRVPVRLMKLSQRDAGIWLDASNAEDRRAAVLRQPNTYQTSVQFFSSWASSLMLAGNAYILLEHVGNVVNRMHVLDPGRVEPMVSPDGVVVYKIKTDNLSGVSGDVYVPTSGIIHDRINTLCHPLIGVSPIMACALTASASNAAARNALAFFSNFSQPGGVMTAPGAISDDTAARIKTTFTENFSGKNLGSLLVLGDGLQYQALTIAAKDAQLAETLKFTAEDVARAFRIPAHMVGAGPLPGNHSVEQVQLLYYSSVLGGVIEGIEACLDRGLDLPPNMRCEFDLDALLRADKGARFAAYREAIGAGWMAPNEARKRENLRPMAGGDTPYMQQQNYSLAALAKRDAKENPFSTESDQAARTLANAELARVRLEQDRLIREVRGGERPAYETRELSGPTRKALIAARRRKAMAAYFEETR